MLLHPPISMFSFVTNSSHKYSFVRLLIYFVILLHTIVFMILNLSIKDRFNVSMNHIQAMSILISTFHHDKNPSVIDQFFNWMQNKINGKLGNQKQNTVPVNSARTKLQCEDVKGHGNGDEDQGLNESIICGSSSESNDKNNELSSLNHEVDTHPALRKKKLHWGLDTKERREIKASM